MGAWTFFSFLKKFGKDRWVSVLYRFITAVAALSDFLPLPVSKLASVTLFLTVCNGVLRPSRYLFPLGSFPFMSNSCLTGSSLGMRQCPLWKRDGERPSQRCFRTQSPWSLPPGYVDSLAGAAFPLMSFLSFLFFPFCFLHELNSLPFTSSSVLHQSPRKGSS